MNIGRLTVSFYLHGCRSLKDKRRRLSKLKDKFGKQTNLAACESDWADQHQRGQWSFVAVAADSVVVERSLAQVERYVTTDIDGEVVNLQREWLD